MAPAPCRRCGEWFSARRGTIDAREIAVNHQQRATRKPGLTNSGHGVSGPIPSPVRWVDRSGFGKAVAAAIVVWPLACRSGAPRRFGASRSFTYTGALIAGAFNCARLTIDAGVLQAPCQSGTQQNVVETQTARRVPNASTCNPKTCTSVRWDGAREWHRSTPARESPNTQRSGCSRAS